MFFHDGPSSPHSFFSGFLLPEVFAKYALAWGHLADVLMDLGCFIMDSGPDLLILSLIQIFYSLRKCLMSVVSIRTFGHVMFGHYTFLTFSREFPPFLFSPFGSHWTVVFPGICIAVLCIFYICLWPRYSFFLSMPLFHYHFYITFLFFLYCTSLWKSTYMALDQQRVKLCVL